MIHIYTTNHQPATRYKVDLGRLKPVVIRCSQRTLCRARCCEKLRWAGNLTVQVYYDDIRFWCRESKGCKANG